MNLALLHDQALRSTHAIVAMIKDDQWGDPTPCDEWDVRALVNHLVAENLWVDPLVSGHTIDDVGDRYDGDVLGRDAVAAYDSSARAASHAFHRPGAMDAPVAVSYGPVPGRIFARHRILDVVVHGWDLAVATGQAYQLDDATVQTVLDFQTESASPENAAMRDSIFGPIVDVPADAPAWDRAIGLAGRDPAWRP